MKMISFLTKSRSMGMLTTVSSRPLSSLISFRGNVLDEPELCRTVHGKWVPYPKGRDGKLGAFSVVEYGERAVTYGLEPPGTETDDATRLYNNATRHYLARRPGLLKEFLGKWVAFGSGGQMFMADTEKEVRSVAEMLFPINQDEYYADCIGKEIICGVYMDCTSSVKVRPALVNNQFLVDAEYFNGKSFEPVSTKHDTGASMLGVPLEVLSSMKDSSLVRARNVIAHGPFHSSKSRIYHNFRVRINGLETRTTAIQAHDWLLGYPVLIRYLNTINADSSQKLTLTPLPGREDTDDCNLQDV